MTAVPAARREVRRGTARRAVPALGALLTLGTFAVVVPSGAAVTPHASTTGAAGPAAASAPAQANDDDEALAVELTEIAPAVIADGDTLTVRGTVTNGTGEDIDDLELRLRLQRSTPVSRSALESWLQPTSLSRTVLLAYEDYAAVPAGGSVSFALEVPTEELPVQPTATTWGPRGIEVEATTPTGESASGRSFAVWAPAEELPPTEVAVLVPAVPDGAERSPDGTLTAAGAARLSGVLESLSGTGVTVAVDPAAPADLADHDGEVVALPWHDADDAALAHAGRTDLLTAARERSTGLSGAVTTLAWPAYTDDMTAAAVAASGADAVVVAGGLLEPTQVLTYTPTGRAEIETETATLDAVVVDDRLSALLLGRHLPVGPVAEDEPGAVDELTARQLLLADTAVITRERPNDPRGLTLAVPRTAMAELDPAALAELVAALGEAPWVDLAPVSAILAKDAPELSREELPAAETTPGEVGAATLAAAEEAVARATAFARVVPDPEAFEAALAAPVQAVAATGWRAAPTERDARVRAVAREAARLDTRLVAEASSTLTLVNDDVRIPVRVSNALDQPATVQVVVEGPDHRLQAAEPATIEIPAGGQATARVGVHAVGSGTVQVTARLTTPAGEPIGTPTELTVRVRATWEDTGTAVAAGILVILLVAGLVRTARRGRRMEPVTEEEDAE